MATSTFRVTVYGDSYAEVLDRAEDEICTFLEIDEDELPKKVNYECVVEKDESFEAEFTYKAEVIARIK